MAEALRSPVSPRIEELVRRAREAQGIPEPSASTAPSVEELLAALGGGKRLPPELLMQLLALLLQSGGLPGSPQVEASPIEAAYLG